MRWTDIDTEANVRRLTDERYSRRRKQLGNARLIKGKRSRSIPLNPAFRLVLESKERSTDGIVFHGPRGGKIKPDVVLPQFHKTSCQGESAASKAGEA